MSVSAYETASAQTFNANQLTRIGDSVTFDIQAGEWKNGKENFVGAYIITKVDDDQFSIDYEAYEADNFKVDLSGVKIWVNDTDEFRTSPGNQKGKAFAVEPGEAFSFSGENMYVFIHFTASYKQRKDANSKWKGGGKDSATGYDPDGRIAKGNWFMYNTVELPQIVTYNVQYVTGNGDVLGGKDNVELPAGEDITKYEYPEEFFGYYCYDSFVDGNTLFFYYAQIEVHVTVHYVDINILDDIAAPETFNCFLGDVLTFYPKEVEVYLFTDSELTVKIVKDEQEIYFYYLPAEFF